jgi:uncharacterized SAM-binding protein YcdF (DUF218 family)
VTDTKKYSYADCKPRSLSRWILYFLSAAVFLLLALLRWGGYLLIANDPLPTHVEAAIVLQGSIVGEKARIAGAMQLLQRGEAGRVLLSVPKESYWGEAIPPVARRYIERSYGDDIAARVDFCETGPDVNSTGQEARALSPCIQEHDWHSIAVVTSNYHTRRAGILWRSVLRKYQPWVHVSVCGVPDPEFQPRGWWRKRLYAKTWLLEFAKLVWTLLGAR